jgi:hypothetical protein
VISHRTWDIWDCETEGSLVMETENCDVHRPFEKVRIKLKRFQGGGQERVFMKCHLNEDTKEKLSEYKDSHSQLPINSMINQQIAISRKFVCFSIGSSESYLVIPQFLIDSFSRRGAD